MMKQNSYEKKQEGSQQKTHFPEKNCYYCWDDNDCGLFFWTFSSQRNKPPERWLGRTCFKTPRWTAAPWGVTVVGRARGVGPGILPKHQVVFQKGREGKLKITPIQKRNIIFQTPSFFRYYATFDRYMPRTFRVLLGTSPIENLFFLVPVENSVSSKCSKLN